MPIFAYFPLKTAFFYTYFNSVKMATWPPLRLQHFAHLPNSFFTWWETDKPEWWKYIKIGMSPLFLSKSLLFNHIFFDSYATSLFIRITRRITITLIRLFWPVSFHSSASSFAPFFIFAVFSKKAQLPKWRSAAFTHPTFFFIIYSERRARLRT